MKFLAKAAFCCVAVLAGAAAAPVRGAEAGEGNNPLNAVVKLEVARATPNVFRPWITLTATGAGSGVVVEPGRILTCAHCVTDASYIRVRKHNEDALYHAEVEHVDHDADLAVVRVDPAEFMADITPMEIGETPRIQDEVLAIGYPIGGTDISFTKGIVSRIEDIPYMHGETKLLGVQIDAAINPGNSGGPVLDLETGRVAGIAFQGDKKGEALGYMIPAEIIRHFLADAADGKVDGFSDALFEQNPMESPSKRRYYGMEEGQTGVIVEDVASVLGEDSLKPDDVILEIGGHKVANNGKVRLAGNEPRSLYYPIYLKQIGEEIPVKVLRDGKVEETAVRAAKRDLRIRTRAGGGKPDYFLFGGIVFTTASRDFLTVSKAEFHDDILADKAFAGDEAVVVSDILPDVCMEGYLGCDNTLVRSVDGTPVRNLRHLVELVDGCEGGFLRFGLDDGDEWDVDMVVDAAELREATPRVMKRYQIPADRSGDLRGGARRGRRK
jgi:S1-C subfamily serine protease